MLSQSLFRKCLGDCEAQVEEAPWLTLRAANGLEIPYVGYALLDCMVGGIRVSGKGILIVEDKCVGTEKGILGMNVIEAVWSALTQGNHPGVPAFKAVLQPQEGKAWTQAFADCQLAYTRQLKPPFHATAKLKRKLPVVIPPQSEMVLWIQVAEGDPKATRVVMIEELTNNDTEWQVGRTLTLLRGNCLPCRVCNPNPYPVEVPQRQPVAQVTEIDPVDIQGEHELSLQWVDAEVLEVAVRRIGASEETSSSEAHPVLAIRGDGLTVCQQEQMTQLLQRWTKVFSSHEEDFGCTGVVKHQIPTGSAPPSRERYRPVPPSLYAELRSLLKNMLDKGVVRESSSPWAAPIVLVKKKNGDWRFCVDYRKLNALTHKDAFPLPRIEESLTCLKAAKRYSTLDLASGYWQVEVDPADREKTAFATPIGLYEFDRMPFGLCNAPATFQRLMQRCLGGMVNDSLLIYLDDIIVFSSDFQSHLQHLEEVFQQLYIHGLKLQPRKCLLFQKEEEPTCHNVTSMETTVKGWESRQHEDPDLQQLRQWKLQHVDQPERLNMDSGPTAYQPWCRPITTPCTALLASPPTT
ncbi:uncharacterized protein LOC144990904 [Oryzias latipes]